jgi:predicted nucleotidyltransferase
MTDEAWPDMLYDGPVCDFLNALTQWAAVQLDISGVALVGSYARHAATASSDIDLIILTSRTKRYLEDTGWVRLFGNVHQQELEDWGKVTSLRVWFSDGREVEFGFAAPDWASKPVDAGTLRVIDDGISVLFDRDGRFKSLSDD